MVRKRVRDCVGKPTLWLAFRGGSRSIPQCRRSHEARFGLLGLRLDVLHLDAFLRVHIAPVRVVTPPVGREPLVALDILLLKLIVRRRPRPAQHDEPVLEPVRLRERSVPVLLEELARVEVLARRLAPGHEEDVVSHQGGRVEKGDEPIDDHREGHAEVPNRSPK